ncbi:MAG: hypothetical protein OHK0046_50530 [Anaerolineae bacterium]
MAYLNEDEREKLLNDLTRMNFMQAKSKLRHMDKRAHLDFYRNMQHTGEWVTRYDLPTLGTTVTLVESNQVKASDPAVRVKSKYELVRVIVEPMPENRT